MAQRIVVSCDIVASSTLSPNSYLAETVQSLHAAIRTLALRITRPDIRWCSGGDGGHLVIDDTANWSDILHLLVGLRRWSSEAGIGLRIAACAGEVLEFQGVDGVDVVGPALNLAASILRVSTGSTIVVSESLLDQIVEPPPNGMHLHNKIVLNLTRGVTTHIWLVSTVDYSSNWPMLDDGRLSRMATEGGDAELSLYYAKRILQLDRDNGGAIEVIRGFVRESPSYRLGFLGQVFADPAIAERLVRQSMLIERQMGAVLFTVGDSGDTMFIVLHGRLSGYLQSPLDSLEPDFEVGSGEVFGELAFALGTTRTATLVCTEPCIILAFNRQQLVTGTPTGSQNALGAVLDHIVLARVLEDVCLSAPELQGKGFGPLAAKPSPWLSWTYDSELSRIPWRQAQIDRDDTSLQTDGLVYLVAGKLALSNGSVLIGSLSSPPLLSARLLGARHGIDWSGQLLTDISILKIKEDCLAALGPDTLAPIIATFSVAPTKQGEIVPKTRNRSVEGILRISGREDGLEDLDVVFVHGLGGDPTKSWRATDSPKTYWPSWLGDDFPTVAIWSVGYDAAPSAWLGTAMPIQERAMNVLQALVVQGIGEKPIIFVCHSFGGLLVKQMLRSAMDFGNDDQKLILKATAGIVFLSTPQTGASAAVWANYLKVILRTSVTVSELERNAPVLMNLADWFEHWPQAKDMKYLVMYEKLKTKGILVVDAGSARLHMGDVATPVDADHFSIAKPESKNALTYRLVHRFIEKQLEVPALP